MALNPVTDRQEIKVAYGAMARRLRVGTQTFDRKIGYRGGDVEHKVHWRGDLCFWWLLDPTLAVNRWWCCYGIENPEHQKMLSITVETNSPFEGVNRRIGGLFVKDAAGRVYLAHSGKVGGGRSGIGKEAFWKAYGDEQVETVRWGSRKWRVVVIAPVDSEGLPAHIARFVHEVAHFKAAAASGKPVERPEQLARIFRPEFEGRRHGYTRVGEIEASCDHGTVVNWLHKALTEAGHQAVNDRRDLYIRVGDDVTHLFEVKTDLSLTSLYQGVGQLMLHGAACDPVPRRILVVPGRPTADTSGALARLGIEVLAYDWVDGQPTFSGLGEVLDHRVGGRH